ncbi:MAG: AsmA family protein [Mesorhizobium sp.]|nr:AsmA family protein [Mesorhizobium sp.]
MARLFVIIGGLIVLALTVALVGPFFVDWTNYRADFEREASRVLGREVKVAGDAWARLLPFPSVTFSDVRVAAGGDAPAMTVETFSMDAELAPFLRGEVLIFDMRLVRPKATIRIGNDGEVDWAVRPASPFDPNHVTLEKLTITEGAVSIVHAASGRTHAITEINAAVSAATLAGPWRLDGSMRFDGILTALDASTGKADGSGAMRLRLRAAPQRYPFTIEADGEAQIRDGSAGYSGAFKVAANDEPKTQLRGSDGATFGLDAGRTVKAVPDYRINGRFEIDHRRLALTEFRLETGPLDDPYTADGTADIDLGGEPRFQVTATGAQFRFDDALTEDGSAPGLTFEQRVAAIKDFVIALPKPAIPGTVEVSLPAVVAGDTTFRDVRLSAEPAEGGWTVDTFAASMPGRTTLEASGFVSATDDDATFTGDLVLAVGQPSGFAAWLSREVDESIRRLPAAGFSAKVELSSARQVFRDLELMLGGAKFRGQLDHLTPADAKAAILLKLDGGGLDLEGLAAFASLFVSEKGASRLTGRDLDLELTAGPVTVAGLTAGKVDTALRLKDGRLDIDRLTLSDLAGANVSATGAITGFPESPSGNLDASILSGDLAPLFAVLGERFPDNRLAVGLADRAAAFPGFGEEARIDLVGSAGLDQGKPGFAVSASGTSGGTKFSLGYSGAGTPVEPDRIDLSLAAENDDAGALFALYGAPALPFGVAGGGTTELTLRGAPKGGMTTNFLLEGETAELRFDGTLGLGEDGATAEGRARLAGADIEPWLTTTGVTLPGMGLGLASDLSADLAWRDGRLALENMSGSLGGVAVSGDVAAVLKDGRPHLTGKLASDWLPLDLAAALVLGDGAFEGGAGVWPDSPFPPKVTAPFTADLALTAKQVATASGVLARDAAMQAKFGSEGLAVSGLSASLYGGTIGGLFDLKNNDGTGIFTGQLTLGGVDLAALPAVSGVAGKGDISASLTASGKSAGGMVASLSGTGTAALRGLIIDGLNPDALAQFIGRADAKGREIDAAAVEAFAPDIAAAGSFAGGDTDIAFTVAAGVLRTPPVTLSGPKATVTADIRADLGAWTVGVDGEIDFAPGEEALVGSQPSVGFVLEGAPGAVERRFDTQPLAQFLTQRALEIEQARVEAMQALLLEKQRLRREVRYYAALQTERERAEAERVRAEEERLRAEEEARKKAAEEERLRLEAEAKAKAEAEAKAAELAKAEAAKRERIRLETEARLEAEREAKAKSDALAKAAAEAAAAQKAAEDARKKQATQEVIDAAGRAQGSVEAQPALPQPEKPAPANTLPQPADKGGFTLDRLIRSLETQ